MPLRCIFWEHAGLKNQRTLVRTQEAAQCEDAGIGNSYDPAGRNCEVRAIEFAGLSKMIGANPISSRQNLEQSGAPEGTPTAGVASCPNNTTE